MGLNLETLIGILVILILLIVADGLRRVLRDRRGRLRVKLDPRFSDAGDDDREDFNPELPSGSARVVRADADEEPVERAVPVMGNLDQVEEPDSAPPVVMESAPKPAVKTPEAVNQQDLFAAPPSQPEPAPSAPATAEPEPASEPEPQPTASARPDLLEVIVVHMVAPAGESFPGRDLLARLLQQGMRYGEMNIFHRHEVTEGGADQLQFSMANAVEPGTFDIDSMEKETFRGVTFFLKLPGPANAMAALEQMLSTTRSLADGLGGELKDEQRSVLTPQTAEHLRQRVQEFERQLRLSRGQ